MAEPQDRHPDEEGVQQRQDVNQPPAMPPPLSNDPGDGVEHRRATGHQHHGRRMRGHNAADPPQNAKQEPRSDHDPAAPVRPRHRLKVPQPLFDAGGVVRPAPHPSGERSSGKGAGEGGWGCHHEEHTGATRFIRARARGR